MKITHKRAVLRAAAIAGTVIGAGAVGLAAHAQTPVSTAAAETPVVTRLSVATGTQAGGTATTILGADLASENPDPDPDAEPGATVFSSPVVTFSIPSATKGGAPTTATVDAEDVDVVSEDVLRVRTPEIAGVGKASVTVTNEDVTSGASKAAFAFTTAVPVAAVVDGAATSDAGGTLTIDGEYLGTTKTAKVTVGGKAAVLTADTGEQITAKVPAGLKGHQDVVVATKGGSVDAGTVEYVATTPTVTWGTPVISTEKGATFDVTGTDLQLVTGGTLTDSANKTFKVTVKQPTAVADKGKGLKLTVVVPAKATAGEGELVLNTRYTSTAATDVTVGTAGKPTISTTPSAAKVGKDGGEVDLAGTNLHYITSVKLGSTVLKAGAGYVLDGNDAIAITVPIQTKVPAKLPLVITTDGGTVTFSVPVSETALTAAAYDPTTKKITLTGKSLAALTGITVKNGFTVVAASFKAAVDGNSSVATLAKAPAVAGTYTVAGVDASGLSFNATFEVEASTVTEVGYSGSTLTVTGTELQNLTSTTVTRSGGVAAPVTLTVDEDGTSATATVADLAAGDYTFAAKDATDATISEAFTIAAEEAPVVTPELTAVEYDGEVTITVTGTDLDAVVAWTLTGQNGDTELTDVAVDPAGTSAAITLMGALEAGSYDVKGSDADGLIGSLVLEVA